MLVQGKGEGAERLTELLAEVAGEAAAGPVDVPGRPDDLPAGVSWAGLDERGAEQPLLSGGELQDSDSSGGNSPGMRARRRSRIVR